MAERRQIKMSKNYGKKMSSKTLKPRGDSDDIPMRFKKPATNENNDGMRMSKLTNKSSLTSRSSMLSYNWIERGRSSLLYRPLNSYSPLCSEECAQGIFYPNIENPNFDPLAGLPDLEYVVKIDYSKPEESIQIAQEAYMKENSSQIPKMKSSDVLATAKVSTSVKFFEQAKEPPTATMEASTPEKTSEVFGKNIPAVNTDEPRLLAVETPPGTFMKPEPLLEPGDQKSTPGGKGNESLPSPTIKYEEAPLETSPPSGTQKMSEQENIPQATGNENNLLKTKPSTEALIKPNLSLEPQKVDESVKPSFEPTSAPTIEASLKTSLPVESIGTKETSEPKTIPPTKSAEYGLSTPKTSIEVPVEAQLPSGTQKTDKEGISSQAVSNQGESSTAKISAEVPTAPFETPKTDQRITSQAVSIQDGSSKPEAPAEVPTTPFLPVETDKQTSIPQATVAEPPKTEPEVAKTPLAETQKMGEQKNILQAETSTSPARTDALSPQALSTPLSAGNERTSEPKNILPSKSKELFSNKQSRTVDEYGLGATKPEPESIAQAPSPSVGGKPIELKSLPSATRTQSRSSRAVEESEYAAKKPEPTVSFKPRRSPETKAKNEPKTIPQAKSAESRPLKTKTAEALTKARTSRETQKTKRPTTKPGSKVSTKARNLSLETQKKSKQTNILKAKSDETRQPTAKPGTKTSTKTRNLSLETQKTSQQKNTLKGKSAEHKRPTIKPGTKASTKSRNTSLETQKTSKQKTIMKAKSDETRQPKTKPETKASTKSRNLSLETQKKSDQNTAPTKKGSLMLTSAPKGKKLSLMDQLLNDSPKYVHYPRNKSAAPANTSKAAKNSIDSTKSHDPEFYFQSMILEPKDRKEKRKKRNVRSAYQPTKGKH